LTNEANEGKELIDGKYCLERDGAKVFFGKAVLQAERN
jgi:hypothetical protein